MSGLALPHGALMLTVHPGSVTWGQHHHGAPPQWAQGAPGAGVATAH